MDKAGTTEIDNDRSSSAKKAFARPQKAIPWPGTEVKASSSSDVTNVNTADRKQQCHESKSQSTGWYLTTFMQICRQRSRDVSVASSQIYFLGGKGNEAQKCRAPEHQGGWV